MVASFSVVAQDEDDEACAYPTDKSIVKVLEKAQDRKYDFRERYQFLKELAEDNEECAWCWYELGMANYAKNSSEMFGSFENSKEFLKNAIDICPDIHSDVYYYLGLIYYGEGDDVNCMKYFQGFLDFPMDDPDRLSAGFDKKYADVEEIIPEIEFFAEFFANEVPFVPNRVEGVSSDLDEYLPMLSPDNSIMLYTRKYMEEDWGIGQDKEVEELTISKRGSTSSPFDNGTAVGVPFDAADNYGGISIAVDNKEMYITICDYVDYQQDGRTYQYNNCDIYVSHWSKHVDEAGAEYYRWTDPVNLGENVNEELAWESQPSLSGDGQTLFFAKVSAETDSTDIYYSERQSDGSWGPAKSIGAPINSYGNEKAPYIHSDSQTLYFAASCNYDRLGAGGYDIFFSKFENGAWTEPTNIGYPINTKGSEHGLFVSADGKLAYFASNELQGADGYDVFAFELYEEARPEDIQIVTGVIENDDNEPVTDAEITFTYMGDDDSAEDPMKEFTVDVNEETGEYAAIITLEKDVDVLMTVESETEDIPFNSHVFTKPEEGEETFEHTEHTTDMDIEHESDVVQRVDLKIHEAKLNEAYLIHDIYYASNSADLEDESKTVLKGFAKYLNDHPDISIEIRGHTDNVGDADYNKSLSADRAFTVKTFLVQHGVDANRLAFHGYGEEMPKVSNDTEANRAINRRTEFVITSM